MGYESLGEAMEPWRVLSAFLPAGPRRCEWGPCWYRTTRAIALSVYNTQLPVGFRPAQRSLERF